MKKVHFYAPFVALFCALLLVNGSYIITSKPTRFFVFVLFLVSVIVCLRHIFFFSRNRFTEVAKLIGTLAFLASPFIFIWGVAYTLVTCDGERFECLASVPYKNGFVVAYRKFGSAVTSDAVLVRKEMPVLPGIMYVKQVWFEYPSNGVGLEIKDDHILRVMSPPDAVNTVANHHHPVSQQKAPLQIIDLDNE